MPIQLTDNSVSDHTPRAVYDTQGRLNIIWIRNGQLVRLDDLATGSFSLVREESSAAQFLNFQLTVNNQDNLVLLWQDADELGNDIFYRIYDALHDHWSQDIRLQEDDALESSFVPIFSSSGNLLMAYTKDITEYVSKTVHFNGEEIVIENVPQSGRNDLYVLEYTFSDDLAVLSEGITLTPPNPRPGETVTISAVVQNSGDFTLDNFKVNFYDQIPYQGGMLISSTTFTDPLNAGDSATVSVEWQVPEGAGSHELYVIVDPDEEIIEKNESNNIASTAAVFPDLMILGGKATQKQNYQDIVVEIKNVGSTPALNIPVAYYLSSEDGEFLTHDTLAYIGVDETVEHGFSWDMSSVEYTDDPISIYVKIDPNNSIVEEIKDNNISTIIIMDAVPLDADNDGFKFYEGDCDGADNTVYPGALEICDGKDNDCDGIVPQDETTDQDEDDALKCNDCDDNDPLRYPGAPEICDGKDNDCDGVVDEDCGLCGDADNNGFIDIFDALLIAEFDAGLKTEAQVPGFANCDVDNSGTVDIFDALKIAEYDAGIISILCASSTSID